MIAIALTAAAAEDYRLITPPEERTPAGVAQLGATYLVSSGYSISPDGVVAATADGGAA